MKGDVHHGEWLTSLDNVDTLSEDGSLPTGVAHLPVAPVTGRCECEIHSRTMDHFGTVAHR